MAAKRLFIQFTKVDEEKREVHGTLTQEIPDRDDEIFDYDSSKPFFEKWSGYFAEQTAGKSVGNLRAMHRNISAGKLTQIDFNDADKRIDIIAKVVDDAEWAKCVEGVYTGFSAAGRIVKQWKDGQFRRYTANPYEASLADFPCVPTATFSYVKIGGAIEERPFQKTDAPTVADDFADPKGQRLRVDTPAHTRASLALWSVEKVRARYTDAEKDVIGRRLRGGARKHDIIVTEKAMINGDFAKGLYDVGELARAIEGLSWLQRSARYERENEQDDSPIPDMLLDQIEGLLETLKEMVGEEADELLSMLDFEMAKTGGATTEKMVQGADESDVDFAKRIGKKDSAKLAEMHAAATTAHAAMRDSHKAMGAAVKAMGEHCDSLKAFNDESSGAAKPAADETAKTQGAQDMKTETTNAANAAAPAGAAATTVEKTAAPAAGTDDITALKTQVQELLGRVEKAEKTATDATARADEFEKIAKDLAEAGEAIVAAAGGARPGVLKAVGKGDDINANEPAKVVEKTAGAADTPQTPRDAFKQSFRSPQFSSVAGLDPSK